VQLEVEHLAPVQRLRLQRAAPVQRRTAAQAVLGQLLQEARHLGRFTRGHDLQLLRQRGIAADRTQVEVDAGLEQVFGRAVLDPVRKTPPPFVGHQTALGVAGHHLALAQRVAAGVERVVDLPRQRQPARPVGGDVVTGEDETIVLVGGHCLLAPALGTEGQPAGGPQVHAAAGGQQLHQPFGEHIVEVADEFGRLARLHALAEQVAREDADLACQVAQCGLVGGGADLRAELAQGQPLQREQVALGNDVHNPARIGHRQVADAVPRHQQRRVLQRVVDRQRMQRRAHHGGHRRTQRKLRQGHTGEDVVARQDAQRRLRLVLHQHRTDAALVHLLQGHGQRRRRVATQRLLARQRGQPRIQRLRRQDLRGPGGVHRPPRQFQEVHHAPVQEIGEDRAGLGELPHFFRGQGKAGGVVVGGVGGGDGALAEHGADREQVARRVFEGPRHIGHAAPPGDAALADVQQRPHRPAGRFQHGRARGVADLRRAIDEALHQRRRHLREGHRARQFVAQVLRTAGGRGAGSCGFGLGHGVRRCVGCSLRS